MEFDKIRNQQHNLSTILYIPPGILDEARFRRHAYRVFIRPAQRDKAALRYTPVHYREKSQTPRRRTEGDYD